MEQSLTEETTQDPNEEIEVDGFPDYDDEFHSVTDINERMRDARDNWERPDRPTYSPNEDSKNVYLTGIVRSIKDSSTDDSSPYSSKTENERKIEFGLDVGKDSLHWVSIEDSGERSLENEYIRLCNMYGVNPENVEEFYTKTVYVKTKYNNLALPPKAPGLNKIWYLYHLKNKYKFYKYQKKSHSTGIVPNLRHILTYSAITPILIGLVTITPFALPLVIISSVLLIWGIFVKAKYDLLPYINDIFKYGWKIYSHKKS